MNLHKTLTTNDIIDRVIALQRRQFRYVILDTTDAEATMEAFCERINDLDHQTSFMFLINGCDHSNKSLSFHPDVTTDRLICDLYLRSDTIEYMMTYDRSTNRLDVRGGSDLKDWINKNHA